MTEDTRVGFGVKCVTNECRGIPEVKYEKDQWLTFIDVGEFPVYCIMCNQTHIHQLTEGEKRSFRARLG